MKIDIYSIDYHGHNEQCIIADNQTGKGGGDWHLVTLGGNNEIIFNCGTWKEMQEFISSFNGTKRELIVS